MYTTTNYFEPNQYKYYHICIMDNNKEIEKRYDLSFNEAKDKIGQIKDKYNYIVKGSIECVDSCINYINLKNIHDGIMYWSMKKEDIFAPEVQIFANCTEYFKKLI